MAFELLKGGDNQSVETKNLTSTILFDEVATGSPVTSNKAATGSTEVVNAGNGASRVTNDELDLKDDSLYCGESESRRAASYLNWNMVKEAVHAIDFCQSMAGNPNSFSNFMQDVVKRDSFWGADIDLEYSTDSKFGTQVSGFTIRK